ncbi:hypothetical protein [Streptomyces virginiae]|uniref:hypothetical protein n=1 Tax=Streptomyces virginiae TaxID=1961 RepID=UPI0022590486|nr:hypothetical protein [Streptomyces virginiae]MCX5278101.1 hypothetical protein [Streptomyces virginiae]
MDEKEFERAVARGVRRGLQDHQRQQADAQARSCLAGILVMAAVMVAFILLVTYA